MANMVVTNPMWETMATSVNSQPIGLAMELNATNKICKYRKFHEEHHFIPMAMEVHNPSGHDKDHFIMECVYIFHNR
jgi:hypothetical protein